MTRRKSRIKVIPLCRANKRFKPRFSATESPDPATRWLDTFSNGLKLKAESNQTPMRYLPILILCLLASLAGATTFRNPIISSGADPWIVFKDGFYYYTQTTGTSVRVRRAATLTGNVGLGNAAATTVFTPAAPNNQNVWAPELHFLQNKWYLYFAADDGNNANHRMYVAEANSSNPQGTYTAKGKIYDATTDRWAIDGTVLEADDGSLYFIWSGWPGSVDGQQNIYIAPMSNPWTISGPRVRISTPNYSWEGWINEGPQVIKRSGKVFIVYSANASWTDEYNLGLLTCTNRDYLNAAAWKKTATPVFKKYSGADGAVYGPGHASFFRSIDQSQDWVIYHAAKFSGSGWTRDVRIQPFTWNADESPNFGQPVPTNVVLNVPAGEGSNTLTVATTAGGSLTKTPNLGWYVQNAAVTLMATASPGFLFSHWEGDSSGSTNPLTVTMDGDKFIRALFVREPETAPTITSNPTDLTVLPGNEASFTATVSGTEPIRLQWRFNGSDIPGATNEIFQLTHAQAINAGFYSLFASNNVGQAISSNAVLTVMLPLEFPQAPWFTNGTLHLRIQGTFGTTNWIEASTNLVDWFEVTSLVMTNSEMDFLDFFTNAPIRFYRLAGPETRGDTARAAAPVNRGNPVSRAHKFLAKHPASQDSATPAGS